MIRVLQVFGRMDRGGAETMVMNLYRNINRENVQFDFVVHTKEKCAFDDEIKSLGGKIFSVPRFNGRNIIKYISVWKKLFNTHPEWQIVHSHLRSTAAIYLKIANKCGRYTIIHSHSTSSGRGIRAIVKDILQYPLRFSADYYLACSEKSGKWLFGKKVCKGNNFQVFSNAIDTREYIFDESIRKNTRISLSLNDKKIIGHIGRFETPKNHKYLIDIFAHLCKTDNAYHLVLVGDGSLKKDIESYVESLNIIKHVSFLGTRKDVNLLLQAFDFLVFPSLFEGFPVALVEAQATGLPILASSEAVTDDVIISDRLYRLSLKEPLEKWVDIVNRKFYDSTNRESYAQKVCDYGFDIADTSKKLENFYLSR